MKQCCETCKYHVPGEVPEEGDWVCINRESEYMHRKLSIRIPATIGVE